MNNAIKLAEQKGGYHNTRYSYANTYDAIILDPLFWQALGKALGKEKIHEGGCYSMDEGGRCDCLPEDWWSYKAHQYFDLLLTGGDVDAFWKGLLNEKV